MLLEQKYIWTPAPNLIYLTLSTLSDSLKVFLPKYISSTYYSLQFKSLKNKQLPIQEDKIRNLGELNKYFCRKCKQMQNQ